ncbi:hypothetical protein [Alteromonas sp. AMM-1]|uniref:hypothetical protein n=1 Tax=Alteromonas sp. AMM-1 TaxID=3394233 RepID=UPI0039A59BD9
MLTNVKIIAGYVVYLLLLVCISTGLLRYFKSVWRFTDSAELVVTVITILFVTLVVTKLAQKCGLLRKKSTRPN